MWKKATLLIRLKLAVKEGLRLGKLPAQKPVELDPLHAPQGVGFVAGVLDQHRKAQRFQLLFCRRVVEDHGVLHHKVTALGQQRLVIRGTVFTDIGNLFFLHRLPQFGNAPGGGVGGGIAHRIQGVHLQKQIGHGRACKIDVLRRDGNARQLFKPFRNVSSIGLEQKRLITCSKQGRSARVIVDGEMLGVLKLHAAGRLLCRCAAAGKHEGQQSGERAQQPPHGAASRLLESNRSV